MEGSAGRYVPFRDFRSEIPRGSVHGEHGVEPDSALQGIFFRGVLVLLILPSPHFALDGYGRGIAAGIVLRPPCIEKSMGNLACRRQMALPGFLVSPPPFYHLV